MHVCLLMPCGHLLGKGWQFGSRLWCLIVTLSLSHWCPGSSVVLACIDSWPLPSFLLLKIVLIKPTRRRSLYIWCIAPSRRHRPLQKCANYALRIEWPHTIFIGLHVYRDNKQTFSSETSMPRALIYGLWHHLIYLNHVRWNNGHCAKKALARESHVYYRLIRRETIQKIFLSEITKLSPEPVASPCGFLSSLQIMVIGPKMAPPGDPCLI